MTEGRFFTGVQVTALRITRSPPQSRSLTADVETRLREAGIDRHRSFLLLSGAGILVHMAIDRARCLMVPSLDADPEEWVRSAPEGMRVRQGVDRGN